MKTSLLKKLGAIIIASVLYAVTANAQIVYTDVNPDITISPNGSYYLDVNNDGINDFKFHIETSQASGSYCSGIRSNYDIEVTPLNNNNGAIEIPFSANAIINSASTYWPTYSGEQIDIADGFWQCEHCPTQKPCYYWRLNHYGSWDGVNFKYMALKVYKGSYVYYGWVQLSYLPSYYPYYSPELTVYDYAFNSISNQPILAGETSCTVPTVTLSASGALSFCTGDSVTLTAKGTGYLYQWKKNGVNISGATSQSYIAKTQGIYKCKVTNSCGSKTSKSDTVIISCIGLITNAASDDDKIISKGVQLTIAPNPFSNSTTISFSLTQSQKVSIQIFDATGRSVKTLANAELKQGSHQLIWDARDEKGNGVVAGIYFLRMNAGSYIKTKELVIVK